MGCQPPFSLVRQDFTRGITAFFTLQVIYRALPPWHKVDPFGPAAQHQLMITNLRVRLLRSQPCPCQAKRPSDAVLSTDHYAVYDFIVKGSCLCNGHADHCVAARGYQPSQQRPNNMVGDCFINNNGHRCVITHQSPTQFVLFSLRCCVRRRLADDHFASVCLISETWGKGFGVWFPPLP